MSECISVKDHFPPNNEWVLIWRGCVEMGIYDNEENFVDPDRQYILINDVTHWMPMPEGPK